MKTFTLNVIPESIERFTTLLQSGIILSIEKDQPLGVFLNNLPGFTMEYIVDRVQTIFLDGNAVDDLETLISRDGTIIAISAAMPGLAGAIFRKNSLHAALRTIPEKKKDVSSSNNEINVSLKLFNMIAIESGPELLSNGIEMSGVAVANFFKERPTLLSQIYTVHENDSDTTISGFISDVDKPDNIRLKIIPTDG